MMTAIRKQAGSGQPLHKRAGAADRSYCTQYRRRSGFGLQGNLPFDVTRLVIFSHLVKSLAYFIASLSDIVSQKRTARARFGQVDEGFQVIVYGSANPVAKVRLGLLRVVSA